MAQVVESSSETKTAVGPRYKWAVVGMLWFICFFNYADRQAIFSIFPVLEEKYGFDKEQLGLIGAAFTWVYALSAPLAGQVGDRFPRKVIILSGLYVWSAITGFTAACTKVWQFVLVRASEGLGETFYFPASMSLVSDYHSPRTRSRAMSLHQTSVYAGTIGGGTLAGWMGLHFGWQTPFILLGGMGIVLGLVLAAFIREPRRNEAQLLEEAARGEAEVNEITPELATPEMLDGAAPLPLSQFLLLLLRTPSALTLMAAFFGANFVGLVFLTWMPTFLKEKFHLNLALAGVGATIFIQIASMIGSLSGGMLADRWRRHIPGGRMATQATGTLLGAPFILLCGQTTNGYTLVLAMTLFGLCKGIYDANIVASLYDVVPPSRRGTAMGLMNMVGWLGGGLGAYLIGRVVSRGMTMSEAIASTAGIYLLVAALLTIAAFVFARRDVARAEMGN